MVTRNRAENTPGAKVLDQYSGLDYKETFQGGVQILKPVHFPGWVPRPDLRRLNAYTVYESYFRNVAREWMSKSMNEQDKRDRREYGDPNLIVQVTLTSLLGDSQRIVVEGSVGKDSSTNEEEIDPEDKADPQAADQLELLKRWSELEKFQLKLWECERQSVKLGDSVYVLGIDSKRKRPRLNVYDPGFYFPIFDPKLEGAEDFPKRVHIAWEFEVDEGPNNAFKVYVRRITWELVPILDNAGNPVSVSYPWNDEPAFETVIYTDAIWDRNDIDGDVDDFPLDRVDEWISGTEDGGDGGPVDLECDYLPIVHIPNTIALQNHFGDSVLFPVMQIIDDIISNDTDIQKSSAITGTPPITVSGATLAKDEHGRVMSYGPGTLMEVGEGAVTVIDTSQGLKALMELKDALLERLSVNSRTPEALLGRVKPNEVPSGIALALGFAPHSSQVKEMRQVRTDKNDLLLKFVLRMYMQLGVLSNPPKPAHLILGSFLPADKTEATALVVQLLTAKAISLETAVSMLIEAGFPIDDIVKEINRIQQRDFEGASTLGAASGDANDARNYLGLPELKPEDVEDPFNKFQPPVDPNAPPPGQPGRPPNKG